MMTIGRPALIASWHDSIPPWDTNAAVAAWRSTAPCGTQRCSRTPRGSAAPSKAGAFFGEVAQIAPSARPDSKTASSACVRGIGSGRHHEKGEVRTLAPASGKAARAGLPSRSFVESPLRLVASEAVTRYELPTALAAAQGSHELCWLYHQQRPQRELA
jgi:hypothetical protein